VTTVTGRRHQVLCDLLANADVVSDCERSAVRLRAAVVGDEPISWFWAAFHVTVAAGQLALRHAPGAAARWERADNGFSRQAVAAWPAHSPSTSVLPNRLDLDRAGALVQAWFSVGEDAWRQAVAFTPVSVWDLWQTAVQFGHVVAFERGSVTAHPNPTPEHTWWPRWSAHLTHHLEMVQR